jgi:hypothetical protein
MYQLDRLKTEWEADCQIDRDSLDESSIRTANLHQKYLNILTDYKLRLFKLEKEFLEMKGIRSRYYQGQMTREELNQYQWKQYQYKTPLKSELERLLETDENLLNIADRESYIKICLEYTEEIIKSLRERNWQIRNAIEFMKFQAGV